MSDYLIPVVSICVVAIYTLLMPLYLKPGVKLCRADHFRLHAIPVGAGGTIGALSALIFDKWGAIGLFSYLAFLLLVSVAVRMLVPLHKHSRHNP